MKIALENLIKTAKKGPYLGVFRFIEDRDL